MKSRTAAMEATLLARVPETATPDGVRGSEAMMYETSAFAELGIVLHQSDQTIRNRVNNAYDLVNNYPATYQALFDGTISPTHARVIQIAGVGLDDDARAIFEERALERAVQETPGRLKSLLASIAEPLRSKDINARHREARKHRGVWVEDVADGMSELAATLPSHIARGIVSRLTKIARDMKYGGPHSQPMAQHGNTGASEAGPGAAFGLLPDGAANTSTFADTAGTADTGVQTMHDPRTLDQLRADVFSYLLLSGETCAHGDGFDAVHGELQIIIPVTTLTGENDLGADLAGTGPIDAETARRFAGHTNTMWTRVFTDPISGQVLATDAYKPTAAIRRLLRVRDEHCRFPGAMQKPSQSDIDHSIAWVDGGKTEINNLAHLCRKHHLVKHARHWQITHLGDGLLRWTSPNGITYIDTPPPKLRFASAVSDGSDAPF